MHGLKLNFGRGDVIEPTSNASIETAVAALATATALPMTATGEDILTVVGDLAWIARYLDEVTAGCPGPLGGLGHCHTTPAATEALAADTTRCLSHAARTYALQHQPTRHDHAPDRCPHVHHPRDRENLPFPSLH